MSRGFVTIATGSEFYYQLAKNLLLSYRLHSKEPMPFAIMCDRENEYTALFDQVIVLEHPQNSFWDKFQLLIHAPFDETIFIDADCLAYDDLNQYWDYFSSAGDFSGCGTNYPIDSDRGLFFLGHLGPYEGKVHWKPVICGGLYFIRKGPICEDLYKECLNICELYDTFPWPDYCAPRADETVLCLAMAVHGLRASDADPRNYGIPWEATQMTFDIFTGTCQYATEWHSLVKQGRLIHFSAQACRKPRYITEVEKMYIMLKYGLHSGDSLSALNFREKLLYRWKLRYAYLCCTDFTKRAIRKLIRILFRIPPAD